MNPNEHTTGHEGYDPDMFDVGGSLRSVADAVRHNKSVVLITCLLTLAIMTWYVVVWPPVYQADAVVFAERNIDASRDNFYSTWNIFRKDDAHDEAQLIKAGAVLQRVIEKDHLTYNDIYHPFFSELSYLWETSLPGRSYLKFKRWIFPDGSGDASPEEIDRGRVLSDMATGIAIEPEADTNIAKVVVIGP